MLKCSECGGLLKESGTSCRRCGWFSPDMDAKIQSNVTVDNNHGEVNALTIDLNINNPPRKRRVARFNRSSMRFGQGGESSLLFNRKQQAHQFHEAFQKRLEKKNNKLLLCVIESADEDCPSSFIKRLTKHEIQSFNSTSIDAISPLIEINWRMFRGESESSAVKRLHNEVLAGCHVTEVPGAPYFGSDFLTALFDVVNQYQVVRINHTLLVRQWHKGMRKLLNLYVDSFSQLSTHSCQIILFFTVIYQRFEIKRCHHAIEEYITSKLVTRTIINALSSCQGIEHHLLTRLTRIDRSDIHSALIMKYKEAMPIIVSKKLDQLFATTKEVTMQQAEDYFYEH